MPPFAKLLTIWSLGFGDKIPPAEELLELRHTHQQVLIQTTAHRGRCELWLASKKFHWGCATELSVECGGKDRMLWMEETHSRLCMGWWLQRQVSGRGGPPVRSVWSHTHFDQGSDQRTCVLLMPSILRWAPSTTHTCLTMGLGSIFYIPAHCPGNLSSHITDGQSQGPQGGKKSTCRILEWKINGKYRAVCQVAPYEDVMTLKTISSTTVTSLRLRGNLKVFGTQKITLGEKSSHKYQKKSFWCENWGDSRH